MKGGTDTPSAGARRAFQVAERRADKAEARAQAAEARAAAAEARADAAEAGLARLERLAETLAGVSKRLDALERRGARAEKPRGELFRPIVFSRKVGAADDHLHHWTAIAAHLGVKPDAARHLARTQGLPVYRLGRTVAASREAVEAWRASHIDTGAPAHG